MRPLQNQYVAMSHMLSQTITTTILQGLTSVTLTRKAGNMNMLFGCKQALVILFKYSIALYYMPSDQLQFIMKLQVKEF